jgi:hypothetical protein
MMCQTDRKEPQMFTNNRSRRLVVGLASVFALTLLAPVVVTAEEEVTALAPVAAPAVAGTSGDDVRTARALAAAHALQGGEIGSMQEEHLYAIVAAAPSWDDTSGYGSVETSRATIGHAPASMTEEATLLAQFRAIERTLSLSLAPGPQVPSDVRWAPARAVAPDSEAAATRVLAAEQALQSYDLGSVQEEALLAVVATSSSWDETSGYGSVEASRAAMALPEVPASGGTSPDYLPAALASGQRSESAHLTTVALPGAAVGADSDDRIANALFGDQSSGCGS